MTSGRKTLYIESHGATRVRRDGPALRIQMLRRADLLIPLRRVCRIVVMGPIAWSPEAMRGCREASIPVSFLTRNGEVRGGLLSAASVNRTSGIVSALDNYCTVFGSAATEHRLWIESFRYHARLRYARDLGRPAYGVNVALLMYITDHVGKSYIRSPHLKQFDQRLMGFLKAHLLYLFRCEASPLPWLPILQTLKIDLVNDYASILFWTIQLSKRRFLKRAYMRARRHGRAKAEISLQATSVFYESQGSVIATRFRKLLRQHHAQLREVLGCRAA